MKIGIIGTGNMGTGFCKCLNKTSHKIFIGSRDAEKAKKMVKSYGKNFNGGSIREAAEFADIVILAVPWHSIRDVLVQTGDLTGKTVVDITNPLTQDFNGLDVGFNTSAAEEIAKLVPKSKVVKAFNTIFADILKSSLKFKEGPANVFICGDDQKAKSKVSELSKDIGFEPVDVGPLNCARYIEPLGMLNIICGYNQKMGTNIAFRIIRK